MSGKKPRIIYWDTCVFLAWLQGDKKPADEIGGMRAHRELFYKRKAYLATSVVTISEVLQSSLDNEGRRKFQDLFSRPNFRKVQVNQGVAQIAHNIRDYYYRNRTNGLPTVSTPDALQLASAVYLEGCYDFYIFDANDVQPSGKYKGKRGLVPLSGTIASEYKLTISQPKINDPQLLDLQDHE